MQGNKLFLQLHYSASGPVVFSSLLHIFCSLPVNLLNTVVQTAGMRLSQQWGVLENSCYPVTFHYLDIPSGCPVIQSHLARCHRGSSDSARLIWYLVSTVSDVHKEIRTWVSLCALGSLHYLTRTAPEKAVEPARAAKLPSTSRLFLFQDTLALSGLYLETFSTVICSHYSTCSLRLRCVMYHFPFPCWHSSGFLRLTEKVETKLTKFNVQVYMPTGPSLATDEDRDRGGDDGSRGKGALCGLAACLACCLCCDALF